MGISIRGFTIPIAGDTKELRKAFREIDSDVRSVTTEANALKRSLKTDWNMDTFVKAQATANDAVNATEEKVKAVKKAIADIGEADTDKAKEQIKLLNVELIKSETAAKKAKKSLEVIIGSEFKNNLSKANTEIDLTKRKLDTLTTGLSIHWDDKVFVQAQNTAREAITKTNDKVVVLQSELKRLEKEGKTDKNSQEFKNLSVEIDETKLKVKQAEKQLQDLNQVKFDRITDKIGRIGDTLLKTGGVMTAGVTLPLAYVGKQALDTASDLVEAQNVVDVSFKDSAESVNSWSKSLLESNGISELTAKQNAGLYKSMANGMGVADEAGTEMSKTLTELIGDVASFYDIEFEQAGNKLKSVFTGETESLKDIGVVMTEANLNAFALSQGMKELSDDMSQSDKVALRYAFVVEKLKDAHGDFARTVDSEANQRKLAKEQFKELSAELAQDLLPIATDLLKVANDVMKSFSGMSESGKKTTLIVLGLAAGLGPVVTTLGGIAKGTQLVIKGVKALKKANDVATVSQAALNATMSLNPYYLVAAALAAVAIGVTAYAVANDDAAQKQKELTEAFNESIEAYDNYVDSVDQDTKSKQAEMDVADKLIEKYGKLNGKVGDSASKRAVLKDTVNKLNKLLGTEITLIDTENAKYNMTKESLKKLTAARKEEINQIGIRNKAIKAQEALLELEEQKQEAINNVKKTRAEKEDYDKNVFRNEIGIYKRNKAFSNAEEHLKDLLDEEKRLNKEVNAYTHYEPPKVENETNPNEDKPVELTPEEIDEAMKAEKDILDARMNLGQMSEETYYKKLKAIRTSHYGDKKKDVTEMTKGELQLNREIYNQEVAFQRQREANAKAYTQTVKSQNAEQEKAYKDMYSKQKELAKDAYDENKKLIDTAYDDTKKKLDDEYKDEVDHIDYVYKKKEKSINDAIKAIDKEIEARERLKKVEEYDTQIDSLKAQLSYDKMDEFTRREVEAQLKRIEDEKADYSRNIAKTDRKAELQEELQDAKDSAERQKTNLKEMLEINKEAAEEQYNLQIEKLDTMYDVHLAQLETMFDNSSNNMGAISSAFVSTISKGCEEAAKKLSGILGEVNSAVNRASSIRNYQNIDSSVRRSNINMYGSNYTDAQIQRIVDKSLY